MLSAFVATSCDGDEPVEPAAVETPEAPSISVTVPIERLTPFCQAMIDLTNDVRNADGVDAGALIIDVYRTVADDVPPEIADDFGLVLAALEAGVPPPTDPPGTTTPTTPPSATSVSTTAATATESTEAGASATTDVADTQVDEGFAPGNSPAERINSYVSFACRDAQNNPGPPATQPIVEPADEEG